MRRLRIAVYHNLKPGGALRSLDQLLRVSSHSHDYDLYESHAAFTHRQDAGMALELDGSCRKTRRFPLPAIRSGVRLGPAHVLRQIWQLDQLETAVADEIDQGSYDLVFVQPCYVRNAPSILRKLRTPVVFFMHEPRRPSYEFHWQQRRRQSWLQGSSALRRALTVASGEVAEPFAAHVDRHSARTPGVSMLCNSVFTAERILASYGIDANVSYLGVDTDLFAPRHNPAAHRSAEGTSPVRVLSVGRFTASKRHDLVIEALALLPAGDRPRLTVVGEGSKWAYDNVLRDLAKHLEVDLELVHATTDEDLSARYRSAAATICAAELEPFGLTALESIASGTPVVAVNQGGYRESVRDGETGRVVAPTVRDVADGIFEVLRGGSEFDPDRLHASILRDRWTWDDAVARLHAHFDRVVAEATARGVSPC